MTDSGALPRIDYFALGGTIASVSEAGREGAAPALSAAGILKSVPGLSGLARIKAHQFLQAPSVEITLADLFRLHRAIGTAVSEGACGIVISQGTDTLEESAFVLDLLWDGAAPLVLTGAMRNPSLAGADGPANLEAAIRTALGAEARNCGVVIVFNDEIHAARFARKMHTSSPAAFQSPLAGPIGWISEGRVRLVTRPAPRRHLAVPEGAEIPPVALVKMGMGDDGRLLASAAGLGYRGLVLEAFGGGHMPAASLPILEELSAAIPVVLTSRIGTGEILRETYRFPGGEMSLLAIGLIHGGMLDGLKARLLLTLCLTCGMDRRQIAKMFAATAG